MRKVKENIGLRDNESEKIMKFTHNSSSGSKRENDEWGNCLQKFLKREEEISTVLLGQVQNRILYPI